MTTKKSKITAKATSDQNESIDSDTSQALEVREHEGFPIVTVPYPYWTVLALRDDQWSAIFHTTTEDQARRYRSVAFAQWEEREYAGYDDFSIYPPEHRHQRPKASTGLSLAYASAHDPYFASARASAQLVARSAESGRTPSAPIRRRNPRAVAV